MKVENSKISQDYINNKNKMEETYDKYDIANEKVI
jgi:hypothetical protein